MLFPHLDEDHVHGDPGDPASQLASASGSGPGPALAELLLQVHVPGPTHCQSCVDAGTARLSLVGRSALSRPAAASSESR
eukprot:2503165-Rhodomonas_salina.1